MQNYRGPGDLVDNLVAPAGGVVAGVGYVIGALFVVAVDDAAAAALFVGKKTGEIRLAKNAAMATTDGQKVWWDNTTKEVKNASAAGLFQIGVAHGVRLAADTYQDVLLDGINVTAV